MFSIVGVEIFFFFFSNFFFPIFFFFKNFFFTFFFFKKIFSEETANILEDHYVQIRKSVKNSQNDTNAIPITIRQLEAIARIAQSLAKMELVEVVTKEHLEEAIRL